MTKYDIENSAAATAESPTEFKPNELGQATWFNYNSWTHHAQQWLKGGAMVLGTAVLGGLTYMVGSGFAGRGSKKLTSDRNVDSQSGSSVSRPTANEDAVALATKAVSTIFSGRELLSLPEAENPPEQKQVELEEKAAAATGTGASKLAKGLELVYPDVSLANLDGTTGFKIIGESSLDNFGMSVSSAGDINHDGIPDLVIGARSYHDGSKKGRSYVVFGKNNPWNEAQLDVSSLDGNNGFKTTGEKSDDLAGATVSNAGDINNDGIDDLLISVPTSISQTNGHGYVVFGKDGAWNPELLLSQFGAKDGFKITGDAGGLVSLLSAGDINGDGIPDLFIQHLISYPQNLAPSYGYYVVFGKSNDWGGEFLLSDIDGTNGFEIGGFYPISASSAGDVNGDGVDDLVISMTEKYQDGIKNPTYTVRSYVIFGKSGDWDRSLSFRVVDGTNGFVILGADNSVDEQYQSGSSIGDVNNDGIDDLFIQVYTGSSAFHKSNCGYVIFGKRGTWSSQMSLTFDGKNGFKITGVMNGKGIRAGDVNNDRIDDFVITDFENNNGNYVVFGKSDSWNSELLLSSLNGSNGFRIIGENAYIGSHSISSIGNGSGDLIIGATGRSYVLFGRPGLTIANNKFEIKKWQNVTFSEANLFAGLNPVGLNDDSSITFYVKNLQHGRFVTKSEPQESITAFTQQQVKEQNIVFIHDHVELAPSYAINARYGLFVTPASPANVAFINVNYPLYLANPIAEQRAVLGEDFSFAFAANTFIDPQSYPILYGATLVGGAPLPSSWVNFDSAARQFSGLPRLKDFGNGYISINITATQTSEVQPTTAWDILTISYDYYPVVLSHPIAEQKIVLGKPYDFVFADNTFTNPGSHSLEYAAILADGAPVSSSWVSFIANERKFYGTPQIEDFGKGWLGINITATATSGSQAIDSFKIVYADDPIYVANPIAGQNVPAVDLGTLFDFTFAANTFIDPQNYPINYSAVLADGKPLNSSWIKFTPSERKFYGMPLEDDYGSNGLLGIKLTATQTSTTHITFATDNFKIKILTHLEASNLQQNSNYYKDKPFQFSNPIVITSNQAKVTCDIVVSKPTAGKIAPATVDGASSLYNEQTGQWHAEGVITGVNGLLGKFEFIPTPDHALDFKFGIKINDKVNLPLAGEVTMQRVGNAPANKDDFFTPLMTGLISGVGSGAVGLIFYFLQEWLSKHQKLKELRSDLTAQRFEETPKDYANLVEMFASILRKHLAIAGIENLNTEVGERFKTVINYIFAVLIPMHSVDIGSMDLTETSVFLYNMLDVTKNATLGGVCQRIMFFRCYKAITIEGMEAAQDEIAAKLAKKIAPNVKYELNNISLVEDAAEDPAKVPLLIND